LAYIYIYICENRVENREKDLGKDRGKDRKGVAAVQSGAEDLEKGNLGAEHVKEAVRTDRPGKWK